MKNNPSNPGDPKKEVNPNLKKRRPKRPPLSVNDYLQGIRAGDRSILAQAITLIESTHPNQRRQAHELLHKMAAPTTADGFRIGITGSPGVGKSTFIETIGVALLEQGHKVAVLSIDPSSQLTKGSILGDKTRMPQLSTHQNAFVRPTPSAGNLGGVAPRTRQVIELCEAADYNRILIETVGVGQSEVSIYNIADFFLLLLLPGAGDELQGIKRGIVEMADLLVINKSDGGREQLARQSQRSYQAALRLYPIKPGGWQPQVRTCSATTGKGIPEILSLLESFRQNDNYIPSKRQLQNQYWLYQTIENELKTAFFQLPAIQKALPQMEKAIAEGELTPFQAAEKLMAIYHKHKQL